MGHVPHAPTNLARLPSDTIPLEVDMSIRTRLFAATYDRFIAKTEAAGLAAHRAALLTGATGRTLEIGGGTGANLTHYGPAVESLTVTEPEPAMLKRLRRRARRSRPLRWCSAPRPRICPSTTRPSTRSCRR